MLEEIKITIEQFDEAVDLSMKEFKVAGNSDNDDSVDMKMATFMMSLQNAAFASLIRKNLFKTEK
jgi:hypothetical protein